MDDRLVDFEANFSVLDRYGVDVTAEKFITNPAIGRDNQLKELMLILLTPEKSAILIGKPGIGKTAIVEGLAYRMQRGEVPEALKGYTIINIKTASLLGTMPSGESKVQKMIDELKTREKIILFVDEIHMLIGATDSSSLDFANIFKEGLGRGSIKVIGATTTEEYERYILRDKAFTRRFQKVDVPEPTHDETVQIMMGTLPKFEKQTGRKMKYTPFIQERIMNFLVEITSEYKRVFALGSRYPDVCLTLLKQAFSYTVFDNREYMDIFDVRKAIENSKNIYPDVVKKELPRFDKEFNDIILEEKGIKPIEEWRREVGPTRYEQSVTTESDSESTSGAIPNIFMNNNERDVNKNSSFDNLKKLEDRPSIVDKKRMQEYQPVKTILTEKTLNKFAKVGPTAISKGLKEKFNQKNDSRNIDDLLLSSDIRVIKKNNNDVPNIPFKYTVTDELKPGGTNDLLLGGRISSTLDEKKEKILEVETYKSDNLVEKQLTSNSDTLLLDERNINSKKDVSSLHSNNKFFDKLEFEQKYDENNKRKSSNISNNEFGEKNNVNDLLLKEIPIREDDYKPKDNRKFVGYDVGENMNNGNDFSNNINNYSFNEEKKDTNEIAGNGIMSNEKNEESNSDFFVNTSGGSGFFNNSNGRGTKRETLFGAPMYDTEQDSEEIDNKTDIFGQLLVPDNDMIIRDGQIVDNLSGLNANDDSDSTFIKQDNVITDNSYNSVDNNIQYDTASNTKKWKFLPEYEELNNKKEVKFNELKLDDINSLSGNNTATNLDVGKEESFINFNDLNSGKISSDDVNKFISLSKEESKEQSLDVLPNNKVNIDLNLEENLEEENYFDDFFDD